jgi:hypothetical protein
MFKCRNPLWKAWDRNFQGPHTELSSWDPASLHDLVLKLFGSGFWCNPQENAYVAVWFKTMRAAGYSPECSWEVGGGLGTKADNDIFPKGPKHDHLQEDLKLRSITKRL